MENLGLKREKEEEEEEEDGEEDEDEDGLLPDRAMREVEEQNKIIWQLYKEAEDERQQDTLHNDDDIKELHLTDHPLTLTPGVMRGYIDEDEEEEEDDYEMEEDTEYKELMPDKQRTDHVREQNRIIYALYEDSLQDTAHSTYITGTSGAAASENSVPQAASNHRQLSSTIYPNTGTSSAQSLAAVECEGRLDDRLEALLAQEPSLSKALQLNLALQQNFTSTVARLEETLRKNQQTQAEIHEALKDSNWCKGNPPKLSGKTETERDRPPLRYSHFTIPYFKDASGMSAPMNEDTKQKIRAGYVDLYNCRNRRWLEREQKALTQMVSKYWNKVSIKKREVGIRDLERRIQTIHKMEGAEKKDCTEELDELQSKLSKAKSNLAKFVSTPLDQLPAPPRHKQLDWEEIAAQAFDGYRTSKECQLIWQNHLHPSINRNPWKEYEDKKIQKLVKMPGTNTNWSAIARSLQSGRTGFQVMQRWVSFIRPTLKPVKWQHRDTRKLLDAVASLRSGEYIPWSQVMQHLPGFTRAQVYGKWHKINPENNHEHFTVEEDFILIKGLYLFGLYPTDICHFLPGRTLNQLRRRLKYVFTCPLTKSLWSREEDQIVLRKGTEGPSGWRKLVCDLPKRAPLAIRFRYYTLLFWQTLKGEDVKNTSPPPLFPMTLTTDEEEVKKIRGLLLTDFKDIRKAVASTRKKIDSEELIDELEEVRKTFQEKSKDKAQERIQKLSNIQGRPIGSVNQKTPSLIRILYKQFFNPGRSKCTHFPVNDEVISNLCVLSNAFLVRPTHGRHPPDQEQQGENEDPRKVATYLTEHDLQLLEELIRKQGSDDTSGMRPIDMPFIPPNNTTVGAMLSILIHLPVLIQMSLGHFIFQTFTGELVASLKKKELNRLMEIQLDPLRIPVTLTGMENKEVETDKNSSSSSQVDKAVKIHITSQVQSGNNKRKAPPDDSDTLNTYTNSNKKLKARGSRKSTANQEDLSAVHTPQDAACSVSRDPLDIKSMQLEKEQRMHQEEERLQRARKKADCLLFQRMTSLFFWPTFMKLEDPAWWQVDLVNSKVKQRMANEEKEQEPEGTRQRRVSNKKYEEEPEYIAELIKKLRADIERDKLSKSQKRRNSEDTENVSKRKRKRQIKTGVTEEPSRNHQETTEEQQQQQSPPPPPRIPLSSQDDTETVVEKPALNNITLRLKRKKVKSLTRSLTMKKVWEARKQGSAPSRKKRETYRFNYQPRGSRSRNSQPKFDQKTQGGAL